MGSPKHRRELRFKQSSLHHIARVLRNRSLQRFQAVAALPTCCCPPRLSPQGRSVDPGTFSESLPIIRGFQAPLDGARRPWQYQASLIRLKQQDWRIAANLVYDRARMMRLERAILWEAWAPAFAGETGEDRGGFRVLGTGIASPCFILPRPPAQDSASVPLVGLAPRVVRAAGGGRRRARRLGSGWLMSSGRR